MKQQDTNLGVSFKDFGSILFAPPLVNAQPFDAVLRQSMFKNCSIKSRL